MSAQLLIDRIDLSRPELSKVKTAADRGDLHAAIQALADHFHHRKTPAFPGDLRKRETYKISDARLKEADAALENRFIGQPKYGLQQVPEPIDWNYNPGQDPEWTWQFNRHSAWGALAEACLSTRDEKYAQKWVSLMRDWVDKNPPGTPKSWRTLETGIRAGRTWTRVFLAFLESPFFTPDDVAIMLNSFADHAEYLMPETHFRSGSNWGQTESLGLLYVGTFFPEFKNAVQWREIGWKRLEGEMFIQVFEDGAQVELTTSYHQGTISGFVHAAEVAKLGGVTPSPAYWERLEKMYEYTMILEKPDGTQPMLGDSWPTDTRHVLREGANRFNRPDLLYVATSGKEGTPPAMLDAARSVAGYYVMRTDWVDPQAIYLLTDISRWGGGHQHPDALQINLYAYGKTLLPDSGSYLYYGPERKRFGHTSSHSTVTIDDADQNHNPATLNRFASTKTLSFVDGSHTGYDGIMHRRQVVFVRPADNITPYFIVIDRITGSGSHSANQYFHFLPAPMALNAQSYEARTELPEGPNVLTRALRTQNIQMESVPSEVSFVYTQKEPRPAVRYRTQNPLPTTFITLLLPYPGATAPDIQAKEMISENNTIGLRITGPSFTDTLYIAETPAILSAFNTTQEICAGLIRQKPDGQTETTRIEK